MVRDCEEPLLPSSACSPRSPPAPELEQRQPRASSLPLPHVSSRWRVAVEPDAQEQAGRERLPGGECSAAGGISALVTGLVGAGLLGLPRAVNDAGLLPALLILVLVSLVRREGGYTAHRHEGGRRAQGWVPGRCMEASLPYRWRLGFPPPPTHTHSSPTSQPPSSSGEVGRWLAVQLGSGKLSAGSQQAQRLAPLPQARRRARHTVLRGRGPGQLWACGGGTAAALDHCVRLGSYGGVVVCDC